MGRVWNNMCAVSNWKSPPAGCTETAIMRPPEVDIEYLRAVGAPTRQAAAARRNQPALPGARGGEFERLHVHLSAAGLVGLEHEPFSIRGKRRVTFRVNGIQDGCGLPARRGNGPHVQPGVGATTTNRMYRPSRDQSVGVLGQRAGVKHLRPSFPAGGLHIDIVDALRVAEERRSWSHPGTRRENLRDWVWM